MSTRNNRVFIIMLVILTTSSMLLPNCASRPSATPTLAPTATTVTATATITATPFPKITLKPGDSYFSIDGRQSFILSRNLTGKNNDDFSILLGWARQGGTRLIRVHLTHGWWGDPWVNKDWSVNEQWAQDWDRFFDQAENDGIFVLPVFGVWADWNNGKPDYGSPFWKYNPLNQANGGPINSPIELFLPDSDTQNHWMAWLEALVKRWQGKKNIVAWEIFSEINIASSAPGKTSTGGVDTTAGVDFTNKAVASIRSADSQHRPVTLSLAGIYPSTDPWAEYYKLDMLDFIEIHPYSDTLDRELVKEVREYQTEYQKPVLIGESGLWSMTHHANASIGVAHAIWAGLVSGAMNGRALWDNDGYSIYSINDRTDAIQFMQGYAITELPVANFVEAVDFSDFKPLMSTYSSAIWGAAIGDEKMVIGWYRDATCEPPNWSLQPVVSGQTVTITIPGSTVDWQADFYDPKTGVKILTPITVFRKGNALSISLPDFTDSIAFKLHVQN